ncbi:MAG: IS481 family transposase [Nocardioidaceae bacterium]
MRELSVAEQRYQAVLAVISDGETVRDVASRFGVRRQTVHEWLVKYEAGGLDGLVDRSHRPRACPHQMSSVVEVAVVELRRGHPSWGPRRLHYELARREAVDPGELPSESAIYRCLVRQQLIAPDGRQSRAERWRRWERARPNELWQELWQMDTVGGFLIAGGSKAKALTGLDDHSRFCVSAYLMPREGSRRVCEGLALAMRSHGVPEEVLTDNGKVFTGRFNKPVVEVLFDRILRENGVRHRLTQPRSPTTTGKIERFHRALRSEFDTARVFPSLRAAQAELDEWVAYYNTQRPHQAIGMTVPAERFRQGPEGATEGLLPPMFAAHAADRTATDHTAPDRTGPDWVARRAGANGAVSVNWQQVCLGAAAAGHNIDVHVSGAVMQFWDGAELLKTVLRDNPGPVRKRRASIPGSRRNLKTSVRDQPK